MSIMKFETKITLFNSYFDYNNKLKPFSILSIFQDVAAHHAETLGVGFEPMFKKKLYWVLSRVKYDIIKQPQIGETVIVLTWPHVKGRIDFDRDYLITDEKGNIFIKGTSKWCVINTKTRSLAKTDDVNYNGEYCLDVNYEEKFTKTLTHDVINLKPALQHCVVFSDLDHNEHMNNTNYTNLVQNVVFNKQFTHFQINYINECKLNDIINVFHIKTDNDSAYVSGYVDNTLVFSAEVK